MSRAKFIRFRLPRRKPSLLGFSETRRELVIAAAMPLVAGTAVLRSLTAAAGDVDSSSELDDFLQSVESRAAELKEDTTRRGQDAYVRYLSQTVGSVTDVTRSNLGTKSWKSLDPGVFLGVAGRNSAFFVVHWRMEPYALLPPHCHPKTSVCTLGLEGQATLRHFDPAPSAPPYRTDRETEFEVRETRRLELRPGTVSTLTEERDNIHLFQTGRTGARGIDVTSDYGGDGSFSFVDFDHGGASRSDVDVYTARWTGTTIPV